MKYLKSYNESLGIKDKVLSGMIETINTIQKDIKECFLQISDEYEFTLDRDRYAKELFNFTKEANLLPFLIKVNRDQFNTYESLLESLHSSIGRLVNDLNGDIYIENVFEYNGINRKSYPITKGTWLEVSNQLRIIFFDIYKIESDNKNKRKIFQKSVPEYLIISIIIS